MTNHKLRLLYLSNAFPPGVSGRFPGLLASDHPVETRMTEALSRLAEISTVGLLPAKVWGRLEPRDDSFGLEHKLLLWDRKPELWHRWRSWRQLRRFYCEEAQRNGVPDVLLVRNLQHIFNCFVKWLKRQRPRPLIVLMFTDSGQLGQHISLSRRLRYGFKPMQWLDHQAIKRFDACVSLGGIGTRRYFEPRGVPFLWLPCAFSFYYEPPTAAAAEGPIRFGYFGGLTQDIGVLSMVRAFLASGVSGTLHICGFGGLTETLKKLAQEHPNLHFDGLLPRQRDCLAWAQQVDVLVNPRLPLWGRDNSFPSKLFEFAMTGKAILSTRACGVDKILGDEGIYADDSRLEESLGQKFREVSAMDRRELQRRGTLIRHRIVNEYNWDAQARRIVEFLDGIVKS